MKKLLTLTLVFTMGMLLCTGQVLAEETDGTNDGGISELYDSKTVDLSDDTSQEDGGGEDVPEEEISE